MLVRGSRIRAYYLDNDNNRVTETSVIPPEPEARRLDDDHKALQPRKVALIGCGSLGSKIAVMLARGGVGNFILVDDDLLMPDNFVRHDLDWRDVGTHKADSVASRIQLVSGGNLQREKHRLGGQESSGSVESLIESLAECDLLIDATAEPAVFNYLCAAVAIGKKPLLWQRCSAEASEGSSPGTGQLSSLYPHRCAALSKTGVPIGANRSRVLPSVTMVGPSYPRFNDADVTVIAAHAARMAIDLLIPRDPSSFPNSVYLIGLSKEGLFSQPFETYPIDVGRPEPAPSVEDDSPEEVAEEVERILKLFVEYKNATSPSEPANTAPAE